MADNYLEKKFEEYAAGKAGKRAPRRLSPSGSRSGVVELKFPRRRVMVACAEPHAIVEAFCKAGCQTAFCCADGDAGQAWAESVGAQCHVARPGDTDAICTAMDKAKKAWRDVEVLICDAGNARQLAAHWDELRHTLPMAPDYGRLIVIGSEIRELPRAWCATANGIKAPTADNASVAVTCLYFALSESAAVDGQTIAVSTEKTI